MKGGEFINLYQSLETDLHKVMDLTDSLERILITISSISNQFLLRIQMSLLPSTSILYPPFIQEKPTTFPIQQIATEDLPEKL